MSRGTVAIVGRPNVGKSTIFNRIIGERKSIVEDTPGVTRDRLYGKCEWLGVEFNLIDTGGIQLLDQPFQTEITAQVEIAIEEADVILMISSGREGLTDDDKYIARMLYKAKKPVVLAINKIDDTKFKDDIYDFYQLGLGDPIPVSGSHGIGIGDVLDQIISLLPDKSKSGYEGMIKFAFIGRPNVGKSSLTNAILNQERVIVSNIEGTTRDAIDTPFKRDGKEYVVIDTAGIRKRGKIFESVEKYSVLRAMSAIERSDVILVVLDAKEGFREQDKHVAGLAHESGKAVIIVVNKWDAVEKDNSTMNDFINKVRKEFIYLSYAPIVFLSALTKARIHTLYPLIDEVYYSNNKRISTSVINEVILDAQNFNPAPTHNGKRLKIYYASQVSVAPPTFIIFVNNPELLHFSYKRYLENRIREAFGFDGSPINIIARLKSE